MSAAKWTTRDVCWKQVVGLMRLAPADQDDRLAKTALFTKYTELLPAALMAGGADVLPLVSDLLLGMREVIAGRRLPHQNLFRCDRAQRHMARLLHPSRLSLWTQPWEFSYA
jgi:hypothetical protein